MPAGSKPDVDHEIHIGHDDTVLGKMLPPAYYLELDADLLIVRRLDGSTVAAFSARGFSAEDVLREAESSTQQKERYHRHEVAVFADAANQSSLWVRFFGQFELFCDGVKVALGRRRTALTILKYLLAHRNNPVSQDHLMAWLWPESNLKRARWSLNTAIHSVRKLLGSCPSLVSVEPILLEEGYYRLCPTVRVEADVDEFDASYEQGRWMERIGRIREAIAEYEKGVDLYRGDYLVEDLYEDWTMVERQRLANACLDMLDRLSAYYYDTSQYQESLRTCFRLLRNDPCYETGHRLVMECYLRLGLHIRALRQYQQYQHILWHSLGKDPSPEMQALHRSILGN
jgi:LuxR family transcriptional regulator, maltose regulon positive regulatory protein